MLHCISTDDGKTNDDSGSIVYPGRKNGDQSSSSDESEEEREVDEGKLERVRRVLRIEDIQSKFEKLKKQRAHGISRIDNDDPEVCKKTITNPYKFDFLNQC